MKTLFDIAYLATDFIGRPGHKLRYGLGIVRNMYYLLKK